MKNLKITLSLLFSLSVTALLQAQAPLEYCNNRFGFCVQYPVELALAEDRPINGDGILLETDGGAIEVVIAGSHNVMDWAPEKIYAFEKEEFAGMHQGDMKELSFEADSGGFRAVLSAGAEMEAIRMWSLNGVYVLVSIRGPLAKTKAIEALWNKINVQFNS